VYAPAPPEPPGTPGPCGTLLLAPPAPPPEAVTLPGPGGPKKELVPDEPLVPGFP